MIIKTLVVGFNEANCYILACDKTKEAAIIDPGADVPLEKKARRRLGL